MQARVRPSFTAQCEQKANERFKYIYDNALRLNKIGLRKLPKEESLNVRQGMLTPVAKLALEGKDDAVDLLLKLGANPEDAMFGYAAQPNLKKVAELGPRYKRSMVQGFMFVKNAEIDQIVRDITTKDQTVIPGAYLAAVIANRQNCKDYLEKIVDIETEKKIIDIKTKIKCAAIAKNIDPLQDFEHTEENIVAAIEGFLMGGHYVLAEKLITEKILQTNKLNLLIAYAESGNTDHLHLFGKDSTRIIAFAYAKARNHAFVEKLFADHNNKLDITPIADGYIAAGCFNNKDAALTLFAKLGNTELKKQIAHAIDTNITPLSPMVKFDVKDLIKTSETLRHTFFFTPAKDIPTSAIVSPLMSKL